jgi:hypothetical protein
MMNNLSYLQVVELQTMQLKKTIIDPGNPAGDCRRTELSI